MESVCLSLYVCLPASLAVYLFTHRVGSTILRDCSWHCFGKYTTGELYLFVFLFVYLFVCRLNELVQKDARDFFGQGIAGDH